MAVNGPRQTCARVEDVDVSVVVGVKAYLATRKWRDGQRAGKSAPPTVRASQGSGPMAPSLKASAAPANLQTMGGFLNDDYGGSSTARSQSLCRPHRVDGTPDAPAGRVPDPWIRLGGTVRAPSTIGKLSWKLAARQFFPGSSTGSSTRNRRRRQPDGTADAAHAVTVQSARHAVSIPNPGETLDRHRRRTSRHQGRGRPQQRRPGFYTRQSRRQSGERPERDRRLPLHDREGHGTRQHGHDTAPWRRFDGGSPVRNVLSVTAIVAATLSRRPEMARMVTGSKSARHVSASHGSGNGRPSPSASPAHGHNMQTIGSASSNDAMAEGRADRNLLVALVVNGTTLPRSRRFQDQGDPGSTGSSARYNKGR